MKIYLKYDVHVLIYFHGSQNQNWKNIASNLPLQPHLHSQFIKTVGVSCSFFFFFWLHGRLSKAILKNCLFAITYSGVQGMDRQVGIFFFSCVQGVGMKSTSE